MRLSKIIKTIHWKSDVLPPLCIALVAILVGMLSGFVTYTRENTYRKEMERAYMDGKTVKVLFLDVDGVLNSDSYYKSIKVEHTDDWAYNYAVSKDMCDRVIDICESTGAKIVVSSSWRLMTTQDTIAKFSQYKHLNELTKYIIGVTPDLIFMHPLDASLDACRGTEIKKWLDETEFIVSGYCIVDDDNDMLPEQQDNFVRTYFDVGLTDDDVVKIKEILQ